MFLSTALLVVDVTTIYRCIECQPKEEKLETNFDVDHLAKCTPVTSQISEDAGLYLCEFIYYRGLSEMKGDSVFIHVPTEDILSSEEAAKAIKAIAETIIAKLAKKSTP